MERRPNKRARIQADSSKSRKRPQRSRNNPHPKPLSSKPSTRHDISPSTLPTFRIIAGSYEKLLYGLEGRIALPDTLSQSPHLTLKPIFIFPAHASSIKTVTASPAGGKWLATGSTDEVIKIWDLRRRKEVGGLIQHQGSITQLTFFSQSYLISASEDGTICLFRTRDWELLRTFRGHKGRVNGIAVHPSGKLFLTVGKDKTVRIWDLMRGKASASTKIGKEGELVQWSPSGKVFALQVSSTIDIYDLNMTLVHQIAHPSRVHAVRFLRPIGSSIEILLVSAEDKMISAYEIQSGFKILAQFVGHTSRVKAFDLLSLSVPDGRILSLIASASSDGTIHVYDTASIVRSSEDRIVVVHPLASYDTKGSRLTCICMADGSSPTEGDSSQNLQRQTSHDEIPDDGTQSGSESSTDGSSSRDFD